MTWDNNLEIQFHFYVMNHEWRKIYINFTLTNTSWDRYTAKINNYWIAYTWRWWETIYCNSSTWKQNSNDLWLVVTSWFILNPEQINRVRDLVQWEFVQKEYHRLTIDLEINKKNDEIMKWIVEWILNKSREIDIWASFDDVDCWLDLDLSDIEWLEEKDEELTLAQLLEKYEIYNWMLFLFMIDNCDEMDDEEKEEEKWDLRKNILEKIKNWDLNFDTSDITWNLTTFRNKIEITVDSFYEYARIYFKLWEERISESWIKVKLVHFEEDKWEPYLKIEQVFSVKDSNWEEHYLKCVEHCDWEWSLNWNNYWDFIAESRIRLCMREKFIDISYKYKWDQIFVSSEKF